MFIPISLLIKKNCFLNPKNLSLSFEGQVYSYNELTKRSNQLAYYLESKGVKKNTVVAIVSKNYLERIISIIALWKLGAAYLPIEPSYPLPRINFILDDSNVSFAIIDSKNEESIFFAKNISSILLEDNSNKISSFPTNDLPDYSELTDIAYIAYTSGSTGHPKGAIVTQGNISSIYHAWEEVYKLSSTDIHLQIANFGFDVCTGDIIRAFGSGSQLVICPPEIVLQPEKLYELLISNAINVAEFTPTVLRKLITYLDQRGLNLHFMRLLICGSDSWSLREYKYFKSFLSSNARLINSYGTTEASIDSAYFELNDDQTELFDERLLVPIGRPFPNSTIKILNEKFECCSSGEQGEIYIGGHGVSKGYLNRPNLTKKKFVELTLEDNEKNIFYKTGDLGYFLPDENIYFSGRIDDQIKIMGNRVGLLEIENIINSYLSIQKIVVTSRPIFKSEENFLIAFIIVNNNFIVNDFIYFLKKNLPSYSIPNFYFPVSSFPISAHGKLDRKKLSTELICKKNNITFFPEEKLIKIVESIFDVYNLNKIEHCFFNINNNQLLLIRFLKEIEIHYNLKLEPKDLISIHTIEDLKKLIEKNC